MKNYEKLLSIIENPEITAKYGTTDEKKEFVEWTCNSLRFLSEIGDTEGIKIIQKQYSKYREALTEDK